MLSPLHFLLLSPLLSFSPFSFFEYATKVTIYNMPSEEARGPVHARSVGSRMLDDTSHFCMQVVFQYAGLWNIIFRYIYIVKMNNIRLIRTWTFHQAGINTCFDFGQRRRMSMPFSALMVCHYKPLDTLFV